MDEGESTSAAIRPAEASSSTHGDNNNRLLTPEEQPAASRESVLATEEHTQMFPENFRLEIAGCLNCIERLQLMGGGTMSSLSC